MKIPEKVSLEEFDNAIKDFKSNCHEYVDRITRHNDCETIIKYAICNISIYRGSECTGTGKVTTREIPYCPECEDMPETLFACVHEDMEEIYSKTFSFGFALPGIDIPSLLIGGGIGALLMYLALSFVFHG